MIGGFDNAPAQMGGLSGKWFNKRTGQIVNVRDTVIEGDEMYILTDKGRLSMRQFEDYIQASDEIYDEKGNVISRDPLQSDNGRITGGAPAIGDSDIEEFNMDFPQQLLDKLNRQQENKREETEEPVKENKVDKKEDRIDKGIHKSMDKSVHNNEYLIGKIFEKTDAKFGININCDNFPTQQLLMLKDFYDVTDEQIIKWMKNNFFNTDDLADAIADFLNGQFSVSRNGSPNTTT